MYITNHYAVTIRGHLGEKSKKSLYQIWDLIPEFRAQLADLETSDQECDHKLALRDISVQFC